MREPKAHIRSPEDKYLTLCGRRRQPWHTFIAEEIPGLIAAGKIGLTYAALCRACRRQARLPATAATPANRQPAATAAANRQSGA